MILSIKVIETVGSIRPLPGTNRVNEVARSVLVRILLGLCASESVTDNDNEDELFKNW